MNDRNKLYDEVTASIIAEMESGKVPWIKPWSAMGGPAMPHNLVSRRPYSGINILLLWGQASRKGYDRQGWLTYKQAAEAGGNVRKGEKASTVFFASRFIPEKEKEKAKADPSHDARSVFFLRPYAVFNAAQCDGIDKLLPKATGPVPEPEQNASAEALIKASGIDYRTGGDRAFYSPSDDYVMVPPHAAFTKALDYYRTALHELTHATGHKSRLDRDLSGSFGTSPYAKEELVAEMGAAFTCAALGIEPTLNHAAYLKSWLKVLKEDSKAIFRAATAASKASDWLLGKAAA